MTLTGKVTWIEMGAGTWALKTEDGQTYELYGAEATKLTDTSNIEGQQVTVRGKLRDDVMTMAMIGPVLEVASFEM